MKNKHFDADKWNSRDARKKSSYWKDDGVVVCNDGTTIGGLKPDKKKMATYRSPQKLRECREEEVAYTLNNIKVVYVWTKATWAKYDSGKREIMDLKTIHKILVRRYASDPIREVPIMELFMLSGFGVLADTDDITDEMKEELVHRYEREMLYDTEW